MSRVQAAAPIDGLSAETLATDTIYPGERASLVISEGDGEPTDDLVRSIHRETTLTFTQNDHKWIRHCSQGTELVQ